MDELINRLSGAYNCYDVLAAAYERISDDEVKHYRALKSALLKDRPFFDPVAESIDDLAGGGIAAVNELCETIKALCSEQKYSLESICCAVITFFDSNFKDRFERRVSTGITRTIGPLNSEAYRSKVCVYTRPKDYLMRSALQKMEHRESSPFTYDSISRDLEQYILVKRSDLKGIVPNIIKYMDNAITQALSIEKTLKIALVPFSGEMLMHVNCQGAAFTVDGPEEGLGPFVVRRYERIIARMIEDGVNIAVFPELALTPEALASMGEMLHTRTDSPLRIIVCGSLWGNYSNKAYVLSATGRQILTYSKVSCFRFTGKDGREYEEDLREEERKWQLDILEADGLGRAIITICLDFLDAGRQEYARLLECNASIVPAYSTSESYFSDLADSPSNKNTLTLFCNCCEPRLRRRPEKPEDVGFLAVPGKNGDVMESRIYCYAVDGQCRNRCRDMACYFLYGLWPEEIVEEIVEEAVDEGAEEGETKVRKSVKSSLQHCVFPLQT